MDKRTIRLDLNKFSKVPAGLRGRRSKIKKFIDVPLKDLRHHYWLTKYGRVPSVAGRPEYEFFITKGPDWRLGGDGIGIDTESRRNVSNELGKVFARWFMSTYFGHTYFTSLSSAVGQGVLPDGSQWIKKSGATGDLPDYICGSSPQDFCILEAKGRYRSVGFRTAAFQSFRDQLKRVQLLDPQGNPIAVKGFISVSRWATTQKLHIDSKLQVEDPWTDGSRVDSFPSAVWANLVQGHYASVFRALGFFDLADGMTPAIPVRRPEVNVPIFTCATGPLTGRKFVGGFYVINENPLGELILVSMSSRLPISFGPGGFFLGIDERRFGAVLRARDSGEWRRFDHVEIPELTDDLSLFDDGTLMTSFYSGHDIFSFDGYFGY